MPVLAGIDGEWRGQGIATDPEACRADEVSFIAIVKGENFSLSGNDFIGERIFKGSIEQGGEISADGRWAVTGNDGQDPSRVLSTISGTISKDIFVAKLVTDKRKPCVLNITLTRYTGDGGVAGNVDWSSPHELVHPYS